MADNFTYLEVGATASDTLPDGFHYLDEARTIGRGRADFLRAADALAEWRMHRGAGVKVSRDTPRAAEGVRVPLTLGLGPARIVAPCRVVYVIDGDGEKGFAYGTLPGHPESGEERFSVTWDGAENGPVDVRIRAFSRPNTRWTRAAGPLARVAQRLITMRYLRSLERCD